MTISRSELHRLNQELEDLMVENERLRMANVDLSKQVDQQRLFAKAAQRAEALYRRDYFLYKAAARNWKRVAKSYRKAWCSRYSDTDPDGHYGSEE